MIWFNTFSIITFQLITKRGSPKLESQMKVERLGGRHEKPKMVSTRIYNFPVIDVPDNANSTTKEIGGVELTFS